MALQQLKSVARSSVLAVWPALETAARLETVYTRKGLEVRWFDEWNPELDDALDTLPELPDCPHDLYRLLVQPIEATTKRHALVCENGAPIAIISLRRCARYWRPVTYQCLPGGIAPAISTKALGRALAALGIEVTIPAGLDDSVRALKPRYSWSYKWYRIDLREDYEAYWRKKRRQSTIKRARKRCAEMEQRVDGEGDLEWIVEQWREQWKDDPGQEVIATEDRLRLWTALQKGEHKGALKLHTLQLTQNGRRVAGVVFTSSGDTVMLQCGGRDPEFDDSYSRAATILASIEWAKDHGFAVLNMAGGDYKRLWAPAGGLAYGALFRPELLEMFSWALPMA
ncbi:MAG: GNAT family N-acetyltransferase [Hyphomonadaceae bacterium]